MGSAGVAKTTTLPAVRALPDNCSCLHSICCRRPARPPPAWLRTALRLTLFFVGLFTCQSIRTFCTLTAPEFRLHACGSSRTLDCGALPAAACERWPAEPHLMPQPPVVAKSCSNPRAHKAEVHYQRGTLVESRPCWQVVPLPSPAFPPTSPDEHHPDPESLCQSSLFPFPRFFQHSLSPCTPALRLPLYKPWQIMPRSLQSTSATLSAFMLAHLPLFR